MKLKHNPATRITSVLAILFAMVFSFSGCVSDIDKEFSPFSADPLHPFVTIMDHGDYLNDDSNNYDECSQCHGVDMRGVDNGVFTNNGEKDRSCFKCHNVQNHGSGMVDAASEHPQFLRNSNYDRSACYTCHTRPGTVVEVEFAGSCSNASCH